MTDTDHTGTAETSAEPTVRETLEAALAEATAAPAPDEAPQPRSDTPPGADRAPS